MARKYKKYSVTGITVPLRLKQKETIFEELKKLGFEKDELKNFTYLKRSIDSRNKNNIKLIYSVQFEALEIKINKPQVKEVSEREQTKRLPSKVSESVYIVGSGPAGLFAALKLAKYGYKPIVIEQGGSIKERDKDVDNFYQNNILNADSNIQFGEGGAGTYSDGKLNTRIKSGYIDDVFNILVENGAPEEILWDYKPHVGTDLLKNIVVNIRQKILSLGGEFLFYTKLVDFDFGSSKDIKNIKGIWLQDSKKGRFYLPTDNLILATGHSARFIYRLLDSKKIPLESKPFAMGVRIENPRCDIDKMQYGKSASDDRLGAATYNFTYNNRKESRGVFSFCMCPGGEVVNATSEAGTSLVNGMSYSTRNGPFSNSALVVGVKADDFGNDIFSGLEFQEKLEKKAYDIISNYGALAQNIFDFTSNKITKNSFSSSYKMHLEPHNFNDFFPKVITDNLQNAILHWKKDKLFISERANLIGPETRTSAPVKVVRNIDGSVVGCKGLYAIGEGAGYAGGIVSAAVDGLKIVELSFTKPIS